MTIAFVDGAAAVNTTAGINTTGANLVVIVVAGSAADTWSVSDSKSNTWTALTRYGANPAGIRLYYCYNPTVGSGHTFTATPTYNAVAVAAYSGAASAPFDVETGSYSIVNGTSWQPGSITPTQNNCVVVSGMELGGNGSSPTIDSSFTKRASVDGVYSVSYGAAIADLIQTTASATNPTWSWTNNSNARAGAHASFKAAASGSIPYWAFTGNNNVIGVGVN